LIFQLNLIELYRFLFPALKHVGIRKQAMFKQCGKCGQVWQTRAQFLNDQAIELIGYQANFKALHAGLLYFNHDCKSTLALPADVFVDLYKGPIFQKRQTESEQCPAYCMHQSELRSCPVECECAYIREIIQKIKQSSN
jgi:hypothetical protein